MPSPRVTAGRPYETPKPKPRTGSLKWGQAAPRKGGTTIVGRPAKSRPPKLVQPAGMKPAVGVLRLSGASLSFLSLRHFLGMAAAALVSVLVVLGMVRANHQAVAFSYDISELTKARQELVEVNRRLKMELASLTALDELEQVAKTRLGMVTPPKGSIVVLD